MLNKQCVTSLRYSSLQWLNQQMAIFCIMVLLLSVSFPIHAKPEYIVGLTVQDVRVATIEDVELGFNFQLDKMSKDKDFLLKVKVFQNEAQLQKLISEEKVIGYFGSSATLFNFEKLFDMQYLYAPVINNQIRNRYVLLVRKDGEISQLSQLKKKNIAYCTADAVGVLYLQSQLKEKGQSNLDAFFNKMMIKKNPNLAISATFFKETDATLVRESDFMIASELNPQLLKQLTAVVTSPEYVTDILAFSYSASTDIKFDINATVDRVSAASNIGLSKDAKYKSMKKIKFEDLNSVRDLIEKTNSIKGKP